MSTVGAPARDGFRLAADVLAQNSTLTALSLRGIGCDDEKQFARFADKLCSARSPLRWLDLSGSRIRVPTLKNPARLQTLVSTLRHVDLSGCQLSPSDTGTLFGALAKRPDRCEIEYLDLSGNTFDSDACVRFNCWLAATHGSGGSSSGLGRSRGGSCTSEPDASAGASAKAPEAAPCPLLQLRTLRLAGCKIKLALVPALARLQALTELDVSRNEIDEGARAVLQPLLEQLAVLRTDECPCKDGSLAKLRSEFHAKRTSHASDTPAADTPASAGTGTAGSTWKSTLPPQFRDLPRHIAEAEAEEKPAAPPAASEPQGKPVESEGAAHEESDTTTTTTTTTAAAAAAETP